MENRTDILLNEDGDPIYCDMGLCEWEAITTRPGHDRALHLCAQCADAYDVGASVPQTLASELQSTRTSPPTTDPEDCYDAKPTKLVVAETHKADLRGADLFEANLSEADLRGTDLREANLSGADLSGANLSEADLFEADLSGADLNRADSRGGYLSEADLRGANLFRADLSGANLSGANLSGADLRGADLCGTDLREANLFEADLFEANLRGANLWGANLSGTNLSGANLRGANLENTCLAHDNEANSDVEGFEQTVRSGYIIGYRTESTPHIGKFIVGRTYGADFFSTSDTMCHPGLYLWPSLPLAKSFSGDKTPLIKVLAPVEHTHKAGDKWRTRWFEVVEKL
jgi:uncharacterized protein YjbI with pentapeptide repeats